MAQGKRKLMLAVGAGLVICSGLAGCMNNEKKPLLPTAKGSRLTPSGTQNGSQFPGTANSRMPSPGMTPGNTGLPATGGFQSSGGFQPGGTLQPAGGTVPLTSQADPTNTGMIGSPVVPGIQGPGAPIPGTSAVPTVTPQGSGFSTPEWGSSNTRGSSTVGQPVSMRGSTPSTSLRASDPPPPEMVDPFPPPAPLAGNVSSAIPTPPTPAVMPLAPADHPPYKQ